MGVRLTEANDLVAILNQVLDCSRISVIAIERDNVHGAYRTDAASVEATGVGKANLLRQWVSSVGNAAIEGVGSGMDWRSETEGRALQQRQQQLKQLNKHTFPLDIVIDVRRVVMELNKKM